MTYLAWRASVVILIYVWHMYMLPFFRSYIIILGDADIPITCVWVMVISGPYISFCFSFYLLHFGVRRPGLWEPRTICLYICVCLFTVSIHIIGDNDGYFLIGVWWLWIILIFIRTDWWLGLAGSRHWSTYMYCCLFPTIRRPVPIFGPGGLLSVK